ncbi:acetylcholine receptor subunit alpha-like [Diaphorina citri]|uniref:Acetylcholine receptor subunit alpha-like n=1 Tax=Diaphorina citri TaxID=121845 RepID=A0A3Q0J470_DIACI|nr:acetylcholine receptor subunit alpha-like [Diaphorina citri]
MSLRVLWTVWTLILTTTVLANPDAKRLYDDLLSNYNKLVRPVVNTTDVLRVCIKLKLSQLIDVTYHHDHSFILVTYSLYRVYSIFRRLYTRGGHNVARERS